MVVMSFTAIFFRFKTGLFSAVSALVLLSFSIYFISYNLTSTLESQFAWDSIRCAFIMVGCLHFACITLNRTPYLIYSLILFAFIFANGLMIFDVANVSNIIYIGLTIAEMLLFAYGIRSIAKTKNYETDYIDRGDADMPNRWRDNHGGNL